MKFWYRGFLLCINIIIILFLTYNLPKRSSKNLPLQSINIPESIVKFDKKSECYRHIEIGNSSANLPKHPACPHKDWVLINSDGTLLYNEKVLNQLQIEIESCTYSAITWFKDDFHYKKEDAKPISNNQKIDLNTEFFFVNCNSKDSKKYRGAFQKIFKPKIDQLVKKEQPINVLLLGADSLSRELWLTRLPKTSHFLLDIMDTTVLNAYNIVGDGTPAALIPILTSKHEHELPSTLKTNKNGTFVDLAYPFIWKNFSKELNYATLFNEEWPDLGTFSYRMKGMSEPATDHYPRPFYSALKDINDDGRYNYCTSGRTNIQFVLDYTRDFMQIYKKSGFFALEFLATYSHESSETISYMDDELVKFLGEFKADESLSSNTILILFSDHGPRFSHLRKSIKGLIQERNAFFSIYLPPLFKSRYPKEYENLKSNTDKLATPMDIHATLANLLNLEKGIKQNSDSSGKREKSLFTKVPSERNCNDAGISSHYCSCMKRTELKPDEKLSKLAQKFISYINDVILKDHRDLCSELKLNKIENVYLLSTSINDIEEFKYKESKGVNLLLPPTIEVDYKKYLFQITTSPNLAIYEFTITMESKMNEEISFDNLKIDEETISRLNLYGSGADCIKEKFPDLRKYCYCKV